MLVLIFKCCRNLNGVPVSPCFFKWFAVSTAGICVIFYCHFREVSPFLTVLFFLMLNFLMIYFELFLLQRKSGRIIFTCTFLSNAIQFLSILYWRGFARDIFQHFFVLKCLKTGFNMLFLRFDTGIILYYTDKKTAA